MDASEILKLDTTSLPWVEGFQAAQGRSNFRKLLLQCPDTGMEVRLLKHPAGFVATWHTHHCAHGLYVLEGTLVTHVGRLGPGGFARFPEGTVMEHGATAG
jgi:anti-sigma factor ChrR (cupin superfamily)